MDPFLFLEKLEANWYHAAKILFAVFKTDCTPWPQCLWLVASPFKNRGEKIGVHYCYTEYFID